MALSLGVTVLVVLGLNLLIPRVTVGSQPPVNVALGVRAAATQLDFEPAQPQGLSDKWLPTSVRTGRAKGDIMTWHVGYQTPSQQYAAFDQASDVTPVWLRQEVGYAPQAGTQVIAGQLWQRWVRLDKLQNSLVRQQGRVTTVISGTAAFDELQVLAASLRPAA
jgi:hypothetical protein